MPTLVSEKTGLRLVELVRRHGSHPFILMLSAHEGGAFGAEERLGVINFLMRLSDTGQLLYAMEETLNGVASPSLGDTPWQNGAAVSARQGTLSASLWAGSRLGEVDATGSPTSRGAPASGPGREARAAPASGTPLMEDISGPQVNWRKLSDPIKKAVQYIEENFSGQISLQQVANVVHLNPSYFSVLFKQETGITFSEFVTRKRLALAKQLLLSTSLSIEEVARMAGYGTAKYFAELFRSRVGMTPGQYRARGMRHVLSKNHGMLPNDSNLEAYCLMAILLADGVGGVGGNGAQNLRAGGLEMLKRAYLLLLAAAMVFPVGLAGVAQPVLAQVGTVKFMHLWPSGEARQHNIIVNEIIADFMSEHPDAFVEVEALPNEQYKDKITVLAASNQLPDVGFTWAAGYMTPFVQAGQFAPLDELLDQDGLREQFVSGTLQAFAIDGVTYGLPLELNVAPIFYNKRIFARYGLDVPRTWDEFLHVVEVLRDNGVTPIALGNGERWTGSLWYMYLADRIAGPDVVNDAINGRIPFTHPGLIRAAEEVQRLVRMDAFSLGYNALSNAEAKAEFLTEQAAMWLIGSWELPQFTTDETVSKEFRDSIGFFRFPVVAGGAGPDTGWVGGPGVALFINANSTVKDKAEAFAKYFVQQWGQRAVAEAGVIPGTIVDTSKVQLPQMYLDVLDELAAATSITLYADVQLTPAAAQVHLNQIQALFGLQVTPEQFAQAHDEAIRGGR